MNTGELDRQLDSQRRTYDDRAGVEYVREKGSNGDCDGQTVIYTAIETKQRQYTDR